MGRRERKKERKKEEWQGNGGKFVFLFPFIEGRDGGLGEKEKTQVRFEDVHWEGIKYMTNDI